MQRPTKPSKGAAARRDQLYASLSAAENQLGIPHVLMHLLAAVAKVGPAAEVAGPLKTVQECTCAAGNSATRPAGRRTYRLR